MDASADETRSPGGFPHAGEFPVWDESTPGFGDGDTSRGSFRRVRDPVAPPPGPAPEERTAEGERPGGWRQAAGEDSPGGFPRDAAADAAGFEVSPEDRTWGALCHVAGLAGWVTQIPGAGVLGPLVIWLCRRDSSSYVDRQGRAAVNFQLLMALLYGLSMLLAVVLIGIPMMFAVAAVQFVLVLVGTIRAATGRGYRYPVSIDVV